MGFEINKMTSKISSKFPSQSSTSWEDTSAGLTLKRLAQARSIKSSPSRTPPPPPTTTTTTTKTVPQSITTSNSLVQTTKVNAHAPYIIGDNVEVKLTADIVRNLEKQVTIERQAIEITYEKGPLGLAVMKHEVLIGKLKVTKATGQSSEQGLMIGDIIDSFNDEKYFGGATQFKKLLMGTPRPFTMRAIRQPDMSSYEVDSWYGGVISNVDKDGSYEVSLSCSGKSVVVENGCIRSIKLSKSISIKMAKTVSIREDGSYTLSKKKSVVESPIKTQRTEPTGCPPLPVTKVLLQSEANHVERIDDEMGSMVNSETDKLHLRKASPLEVEKKQARGYHQKQQAVSTPPEVKQLTSTVPPNEASISSITEGRRIEKDQATRQKLVMKEVEGKTIKEADISMKLAVQEQEVRRETKNMKVSQTVNERPQLSKLNSMNINDRIKSESELRVVSLPAQVAIDRTMVTMMKRSIAQSNSQKVKVPNAKHIDKDKLKEAIYRKLHPEKFEELEKRKEASQLEDDTVPKDLSASQPPQELVATPHKPSGETMEGKHRDVGNNSSLITPHSSETKAHLLSAPSSVTSHSRSPLSASANSPFSASSEKKVSPLWEKIKNIVDNKKFLHENSGNLIHGVIRSIDRDYDSSPEKLLVLGETAIEKSKKSEVSTQEEEEEDVRQFDLGDKVIAAYAGGVEGWFSGIVDKIYEDGTFAIQYDMGEWEGHVPADHIKLTNPSKMPKTTSPIKAKKSPKGGSNTQLEGRNNTALGEEDVRKAADEGVNFHEFIEFFGDQEGKERKECSTQVDSQTSALQSEEYGLHPQQDNEDVFTEPPVIQDRVAKQWLSTVGFAKSVDIQALTQGASRYFCDVGSPLHRASFEGEVSMLAWLYEQGARDIDGKNHDGFAPIHWASRNGHLKCCQFLVSKGANISLPGHKGWLPYHLAAENGHVYIVQWLNKTAASNDIFEVDRYGWTPLQCAAHGGHIKCLELLHSIMDTKQKECEERRVRQSFTDRSEEENYVLPTRVKDLKSGSTTLHISAIAGHVEICHWLMKDDVKRIANLTSKLFTSGVKQSSSSARERKHQEFQQEYNDLPTLKNDYKETAVVLAAENGHLNTLKVLVNYKEPSQSDDRYEASYVFEGNDDKEEDQLYELRRRNQFGFPPFHYACSRGQLEVCKWLIVKGGVNYDKNQMLPDSRAVSSLDHVDPKLMVRMSLSDRSNILRSGGSKFINMETKKLLLIWAQDCMELNYTFLSTILFGICYVEPSSERLCERLCESNQKNGASSSDVIAANSTVDTQIISASSQRIKQSGVSGLKDDCDEDARRRILKGQPPIHHEKPSSMAELRMRRIQALELNKSSNSAQVPHQAESQQEIEENNHKQLTLIPLEDESLKRPLYKGGGCPANGLPLLEGYEDSIVGCIADFLGVLRGRDLRLTREFSEAKAKATLC